MTIHGQAMLVSRRLDSQLKRERVAATVDALAATGQELSIAATARHADVSRKFVYAHPDLRARVEQRAQQAVVRAGARAAADGHVTVASLRADLANAKARNHRLRQQLRALEQRLSEALGRDIADARAPRRAPRRAAQPTARRPGADLRLQEQLADAREELDPSARSTASCSPTETGRGSDHVRSRRARSAG